MIKRDLEDLFQNIIRTKPLEKQLFAIEQALSIWKDGYHENPFVKKQIEELEEKRKRLIMQIKHKRIEEDF